jgi:hypothetical protein
MQAVWDWTKIGLVLGGLVIAMIGMVWYRTARLIQTFGRPANPDRGFWVMLAGFLMLALGLSFFYLKL